MALQPTDLLVVHRPGPGEGALYNCPVSEFLVDASLATEDREGIVRLATVEEVIEGDNNQLAISPKNLQDGFAHPEFLFDGNSGFGDDDYNPQTLTFTATPTALPPASESEAGIVRLATAEETETGTNASIAITPAGLRAMLDSPTYALDAGVYSA